MKNQHLLSIMPILREFAFGETTEESKESMLKVDSSSLRAVKPSSACGVRVTESESSHNS